MHPTRTNITVTTTSPKDWKYVSEGGATIVFSFTGDTVLHPSFKGMVLRLRKISRGIPTAGTETCPQDLQEGDKDEVQMIAFHRKIIARLIPLENLPLLASVCVDRAWLQALADLREPERPEDRRRTDGIDLDSRGAIMATDLVGGAGIVAEIKASFTSMHKMAGLDLIFTSTAEVGFLAVACAPLGSYVAGQGADV